jgi:hypothetical protein
MHIRSDRAFDYSCTQISRYARLWVDLGDLGKLALQNMHLGCVTALLMYGVTVPEPYISPCAYSNRLPAGAYIKGHWHPAFVSTH